MAHRTDCTDPRPPCDARADFDASATGYSDERVNVTDSQTGSLPGSTDIT